MPRSTRRAPTAEELRAASDRLVPDVIAPDLRVLFCGINPGLVSALTGHHFARPGNRFWPTLHGAGFTDRLLQPSEERELLRRGYGITNMVERASATAAELTPEEMIAGGQRLDARVQEFRPRWLAILGISVYRAAFARPRAVLGEQEQTIGATRIWVLPNPSGLNAHYRQADLIRLYRELREAAERDA